MRHPNAVHQIDARPERFMIKLKDWPAPFPASMLPNINILEMSKSITDELFKIGLKAKMFVEKEEEITPSIKIL